MERLVGGWERTDGGGGGVVVGRHQRPLTEFFPEIVEAPAERFHGEVVLESPAGWTSRRGSAASAGRVARPPMRASYVVFDLLGGSAGRVARRDPQP